MRVFVTPTCPYCPQMARAAFMMGIVTEHVKAEVIEINEFPDLAKHYKVEAVPLTVINDRISIPGALSEPALVEQIVKGAGAKPSKDAPGGPTSEPEKPERIERGKRRDSGLYIP